jgi:hypothetical protein
MGGYVGFLFLGILFLLLLVRLTGLFLFFPQVVFMEKSIDQLDPDEQFRRNTIVKKRKIDQFLSSAKCK